MTSFGSFISLFIHNLIRFLSLSIVFFFEFQNLALVDDKTVRECISITKFDISNIVTSFNSNLGHQFNLNLFFYC